MAHFQPMVSIKRQAVFAVESLARGQNPDGSIIPPLVLFDQVHGFDARLNLDRRCRQRALETFTPIYERHHELLLSINLDASVLSRDIVGSGHLLDAVQRQNVRPSNVIIEIIESQVADVAALLDFVRTYREHGFIIALDDVGAGHSNLDRISLLKPDIIKIDRALIRDIDTVHHKQEIARSLVRLCTGIGALAVAEGVEREEEILTCLELGFDLFQGYYFAKPAAPNGQLPPVAQRLAAVAAHFAKHRVESINARRARHEGYMTVAREIVATLQTTPPQGFNRTLADCVYDHPDLECLYILDHTGFQLSETVCNQEKLTPRNRFIYQPARPGTDHSLKDYFLPLRAGLRRHTTEPAISLASGNLCQTLSVTFRDSTGQQRVLCMDVTLENR